MGSNYVPNREARRIAEWQISLGHSELAKDVLLAGAHWEWNPNEVDRSGTHKSGHARTGPRR